MTQQASIASMHQGGPSGWWATYLGHRYAVLFYSLLLTLVGAPILKAIGMPGTGMQVFLGLNLLAAALFRPTVEKGAGFCRRFYWSPSCLELCPRRPATQPSAL